LKSGGLLIRASLDPRPCDLLLTVTGEAVDQIFETLCEPSTRSGTSAKGVLQPVEESATTFPRGIAGCALAGVPPKQARKLVSVLIAGHGEEAEQCEHAR
jgi:hypothetical protein